MVWHVATTACQSMLDQIIVITGAYQREVTSALNDLPLQIIYNENWQQGQSTSVKKAVQSIQDETQAVVFLLADQPLVDVSLINELIKGLSRDKCQYCDSSCAKSTWQSSII